MQCVTTSAEGFDLASFGYVNYYDKDHWDGPSTRQLRESVDGTLFDRFAQLKDPLIRTLEDSDPSLDIAALERDAMMGVQLVDYLLKTADLQSTVDCIQHTWVNCSDKWWVDIEGYLRVYGNNVPCSPEPHWETPDQPGLIEPTLTVGEVLHTVFKCALTETGSLTTPLTTCAGMVRLPTVCDMEADFDNERFMVSFGGMEMPMNFPLVDSVLGVLYSWTPGVCDEDAPLRAMESGSPRAAANFDALDDAPFLRDLVKGVVELPVVGPAVTDSVTSYLSLANVLAAIFVGIANVGFGTFDVLLTFPRERIIFNRETANGLYSPWLFYLAKNLADLPFQLIPNCAMMCIYYWMAGFNSDAGKFGVYMGITALVSLAAYGFGYLASAAAPRMEVAVVGAPFCLILMLMVCGFFLRDTDMPVWISWARWVSIYRYGFTGFVVSQFSPLSDSFGVVPNQMALTIAGVMGIWTNLSFNVGMLCVLAVSFRMLGFVCLKYMNRRAGTE